VYTYMKSYIYKGRIFCILECDQIERRERERKKRYEEDAVKGCHSLPF
jgi:hypothetical protein